VTKYGDRLDGHEWHNSDPSADPRPRTEVDRNIVVIDEFVKDGSLDYYRWRFSLVGRTVVGWTRSAFEHDGTSDCSSIEDWSKVPDIVKGRLAQQLGYHPSRLDDHLDLPDFYGGDQA